MLGVCKGLGFCMLGHMRSKGLGIESRVGV